MAGRFRGVYRSLWLRPGHLFNFIAQFQSRRKWQIVSNPIYSIHWSGAISARRTHLAAPHPSCRVLRSSKANVSPTNLQPIAKPSNRFPNKHRDMVHQMRATESVIRSEFSLLQNHHHMPSTSISRCINIIYTLQRASPPTAQPLTHRAYTHHPYPVIHPRTIAWSLSHVKPSPSEGNGAGYTKASADNDAYIMNLETWRYQVFVRTVVERRDVKP